MYNTITAYLMGGLGNQMFQISNAYAQSLKNNAKCIFKPESFTPLQGNETNKYLKNIFKNINFSNDFLPTSRHNEISWSYYQKPFPIKENVEFYGYFQSSKNFEGFDLEIKKLFLPSDHEIKILQTKYPEIVLNNTVSIHIRRGDYVNSPNIHPTVSLSYLKKSLENIGSYDHLFIFTDDKKFVENNFNGNNLTIVNDEDYYELWLMSLCKNNIISNSTFSWWGSYLNKNKNKRVIAPSIWFGDNGPQNYKDIYEDYWEIINVEIKNGELIYVA